MRATLCFKKITKCIAFIKIIADNKEAGFTMHLIGIHWYDNK